ncbi:hypothetical protein GCM10009682_08500 [Luedemannella flava]|uniref:DUF732 domain-containing protein n=1 Tax=Luedemannella flava TaxID=349316 RepID=A0ABP4XUN2_9ACTN
MSVHVDSAPRTKRIITYVVLGAIFLILLLIALGTFQAAKRNTQATQLAGQLQQELQKHGLPVPSTGQITSALGTDGGLLCDDPALFLDRAIAQYAMSGAGGPGARPTIAPATFAQGAQLAVGVYCPDKATEFANALDDYELHDA